MSKKNEVTLGGVFCGREIAPGLFSEEFASCRFQIRLLVDADYARRIGEVVGSPRNGAAGGYQALTPRGDTVAVKDSLVAAAKVLADQARAASNVAAQPKQAVPFISARAC